MRFVLILLLLSLSSFAALGWDVAAGRPTFKYLKKTATPRDAALGGAGLASPEGQAGVDGNPLVLAVQDKPTVQFGRFWEPSDLGTDAGGAFSLLLPLVDDAGQYGLGISARYLGWKDLDGRDEDGASTGEFGADVWTAALGVGRRSGPFSLGLQARYVQQTISRWLARGVLADGAVSYRIPRWGISMASGVRNLGWVGGYTSGSQEFAPLTLQNGIAWEHSWTRLFSSTAMLDLRRRSDEDPQFLLGAELRYAVLALRLGSPLGGDTNQGLSAGLGIRWEGLGVDYSYVGNSDLGGEHGASLSLAF